MPSDEDDELEKLLGELGDTEPLSPKKEESIEMPPRSRPKKKVKKIDVSIAKNDSLLMLQPAPVATPKDLPAVFTEQLQKVASQYGSVFEEIIATYKTDRDQAQEVIDMFMDTIANGGKVPRIYIEKIADAVRAKNEIAQTAIKALDALPKLISATKGNEMFQNNVSMSFDSKHLKDILEAAGDSE